MRRSNIKRDVATVAQLLNRAVTCEIEVEGRSNGGWAIEDDASEGCWKGAKRRRARLSEMFYAFGQPKGTLN